MLARASILALSAAIAALSSNPAAAQEAAAPGRPAILDEYNVDVYGGGNAARVAAGVTFGNVRADGFWWSYGGRVSWSRFVDGGPVLDGWGLGATAGGGWRPDRVVSPVVGIAAEKTFGTGGLIDFQTQVHGGARVRVTPDAHEYLAFTFALYGSRHFFGKGLPDKKELGIAVLFSTARFAAR